MGSRGVKENRENGGVSAMPKALLAGRINALDCCCHVTGRSSAPSLSAISGLLVPHTRTWP